VEHSLVPASNAIGRKLKDGSISQPPATGRSVEVARRVSDKAPIGIGAIAALCEVVEQVSVWLSARWAAVSSSAERAANIRAPRETAIANFTQQNFLSTGAFNRIVVFLISTKNAKTVFTGILT
jgi:hypothetical protein